MKKVLKIAGTIGAYALPALAFAATGNLSNVDTLVGSVGNIIAKLIPIVFALALIYFFWGLAKYILASGDEEKRKEGKGIMIWGIVAIFVMASIFGIVKFIQEALGVSTTQEDFKAPGVKSL